jgi:hypothetical protein
MWGISPGMNKHLPCKKTKAAAPAVPACLFTTTKTKKTI